MGVVELVAESQKLSKKDLLFWYKSIEKDLLEALDAEAEKEAILDMKNGNINEASSGSELISLCQK